MNRVVKFSIIGIIAGVLAVLGSIWFPAPRKIEKTLGEADKVPLHSAQITAVPTTNTLQPVVTPRFPPPAYPPAVKVITAVTETVSSSVQVAKVQRTVFGNGIPFGPADLPVSPLRQELESLPPGVRDIALSRLTKMSFHVNDLDSLHVDRSGMPYYTCTFSNAVETGHPATVAPTSAPSASSIPFDNRVMITASATPISPGVLGAVAITSPPIRHSKPGSSNILYLDFNGAVITNTAWNNNATYGNVSRWDCRPFDTDGNTNTFSDTEQGYIIQIWERVAEDYMPFDVDVTTEQPTNWNSTTGHALITPTTDASGINCPHYGYGGIAYVNCFGDYNYSYNATNCYSPAFITPMSGDCYASTAEAASHELGHNMGLSHDGYLVPPTTNGYYSGHGSGDISWGPIMGSAYGKNVTQWSKGEYYGANQTQDDLSIISGKAPYRADDHGNTTASATLLINSNGLIISSGIISSNTDVDVISFSAGVGSICLTVFPYRCANGTYGGNLDIHATLYNGSGTQVADYNQTNQTQAYLNYSSPSNGNYYLFICNSGTGNPTNASPSGYTSYGSIGQYFVTGSVPLAVGIAVQNPNGGEIWFKGQTNTIRWASSTNVGANVKIELYRGGNTYYTVTNSVTNSGSFAWIITNTLLSVTNYQIRISSLTQTSLWDGSDANFTLATAPTNLFFENFDASPNRPAGWTETNLVGDILPWEFLTSGYWEHPTAAHSGPYFACFYDFSTNSDICRLATPAINVSGFSRVVLQFWHYMEMYDPDQDYLNIWVKTNATASWVWIAGYSNSICSWSQQTLTLPNPSTNYTIGFAGNAKYGYGVCLDDVEVLGIPIEPTVATNSTPLVWLADYCLATTDAGALSDTDNDGMKAWEEWVAGTCPTQNTSFLSVSNTWNADHARILLWSAVTGRTYSVNWSSNLLTATFQALVTNNTTGIYTDTVHAAEQSGFYRLGVQKTP